MVLFYILVLLAAMPNHPLFEEPFAGLTFVKWLGILCCGYALFVLLNERRLPAFVKPWPVRLFAVLFGIAAVSFFTLSRTEGLTFNPMFTYASYVMLFLTTISLVNSYQRLHRTLLASIAGAAWASLYVIREFQVSGGTNLRPGYVAGDSNYFAICAVLVIPAAVYFLKLRTTSLERWFCGISLVLILVAFTLASSRGGLVGLGVATAYMLVRSGQSRRAAVLTTLLLIPMLLLAPSSPLSRFLHPSYADQVSEQIRRDFWSAGLDMIGRHPLTGVGLGNFTAQSISTIDGKQGMACNTFLEIAAELGVPGALVYGGIVFAALWSAGQLRRAGKDGKNTVLLYTGQAMQAGLLGFAAAAVFVSAEYQKPFWIMIALTSAIPLLLAQSSRRQPAAEATFLWREDDWVKDNPELEAFIKSR